MRNSAGPSFTPDAAKATDATVDATARDEAAQGLIRGHAVREAASDALLRASEGTDERDTGSQIPGDVGDKARDMVRIARRARDAKRRGDEPSGEKPAGTHVPNNRSEAPDAEEPANANAATPHHAEAPDTGSTSGMAAKSPSRIGHVGKRNAGDAMPRTPPKSDATPRSTFAPRASTGTSGRMPVSEGARLGHRHRAANVTSARESPGKAHQRPTKMLARTSTNDRVARLPKARRTTPRGAATSRAPAMWRGAGAAGARASAATASAAAGAGTAATGETAVAAAPLAIVALVAFLLVFVLLSLLAGGAVEQDQLTGAHRLAQTATDEYLAGEARGDYNHKGHAYSAFVRGTHGGKDDWDVCLVGWCMAQAGFVDAGLTHPYGDVGSYVAHFRHNPRLGEVHDWDAGDYAPVEGDLFVSWYSDGTQHIGIVTSCDGTWFESVEGDVAGGPNGTYDRDEEDGHGGYVACRARRIGQYSYTFIHPYYSEEAVTGG